MLSLFARQSALTRGLASKSTLAAAATTAATTKPKRASKKALVLDGTGPLAPSAGEAPPATTAAPPKPTRALSGYNVFTKDLFKNHPGTTMAMAGQSWTLLSAAEKDAFSKKAAELPRAPAPVPKLRQPKKKSSWDVYLAEFRKSPESAGLAPQAILTKAAEKYKRLTPEDKAKLTSQ
ncbi:hypothetical protein BASA81_010727 [Batrachochytrium salamandrivorans]|nr:hypothetical protein BASA81_010727 [Batrachochytrium salamandrivorans]